jgi:serine/threonine protein kinase
MIELEKYEIVGEIGRGGMATVYKARHRVLHSHVAIKVLSGQFTHDGEFLKRFINGARSAASLKHENIIPVYDVGDEKGNYYIVMEYLEGETLEERIKRTGAIPEPEIEAIMKPLAGALEYAHSRGVIHRDIKSANIFLVKGGRVVLMDFDIAKASDTTLNLTQDGTLLGTPAYMSPEQARGEKADHRSDVYSFGVVLYEMATGRLPFQGENTFSILNQIATTDPAPPRELNPKLDGELGDRILWCMGKSPGERPAKAMDIFEADVPGRKARKEKKKGAGFGFGKGKGKKDDGAGKKAAPAEHAMRPAETRPAAEVPLLEEAAGKRPAAASAAAAPDAIPGVKGRDESPAIDLNAITRPRKKRRGIGRRTSRLFRRAFWLAVIVVAFLLVRDRVFPQWGGREVKALLVQDVRYGKLQRPRAAPRELSGIDAETVAALYDGATSEIEKGNPDKVYEKLSAIRKIDPGNLLAYQGAQKLYNWHLAKAEGRLRAGDFSGFENYMDRAVRYSPSMKTDNLRQRAASYRGIHRYVSLDSHNVAVIYVKIAAAQAGKLAGKLTGSAEKKLKSMG